mmetsp:Transcript_10901/g.26724  ORF Transcript_10901/g.26724 Transcript_10901/m.26724 type:complete len:213 (-) Transcript_10901:434-1072(-)
MLRPGVPSVFRHDLFCDARHIIHRPSTGPGRMQEHVNRRLLQRGGEVEGDGIEASELRHGIQYGAPGLCHRSLQRPLHGLPSTLDPRMYDNFERPCWGPLESFSCHPAHRHELELRRNVCLFIESPHAEGHNRHSLPSPLQKTPKKHRFVWFKYLVRDDFSEGHATCAKLVREPGFSFGRHADARLLLRGDDRIHSGWDLPLSKRSSSKEYG